MIRVTGLHDWEKRFAYLPKYFTTDDGTEVCVWWDYYYERWVIFDTYNRKVILDGKEIIGIHIYPRD